MDGCYRLRQCLFGCFYNNITFISFYDNEDKKAENVMFYDEHLNQISYTSKVGK